MLKIQIFFFLGRFLIAVFFGGEEFELNLPPYSNRPHKYPALRQKQGGNGGCF